jgi:hypothetical protein
MQQYKRSRCETMHSSVNNIIILFVLISSDADAQASANLIKELSCEGKAHVRRQINNILERGAGLHD